MTFARTLAPWILFSALFAAAMHGIEAIEDGLISLFVAVENASEERDEDETELEPDPA